MAEKDEVDSLNSEELERQLEEEMARIELGPDEDSGSEKASHYNDLLAQSHTSFKSMMSGATVGT